MSYQPPSNIGSQTKHYRVVQRCMYGIVSRLGGSVGVVDATVQPLS